MKNEILRFDIKYRGADKDKFLQNYSALEYKCYTHFFKDLTNGDFIYVNLFRHVISEVRRQGVNLNQIARHVNTENKIEAVTNTHLESIDNSLKEIVILLRKI